MMSKIWAKLEKNPAHTEHQESEQANSDLPIDPISNKAIKTGILFLQ